MDVNHSNIGSMNILMLSIYQEKHVVKYTRNKVQNNLTAPWGRNVMRKTSIIVQNVEARRFLILAHHMRRNAFHVHLIISCF